MIVSKYIIVTVKTIDNYSSCWGIGSQSFTLPINIYISTVVPPWQYWVINKIFLLRTFHFEICAQSIRWRILSWINFMKLICLFPFFIQYFWVKNKFIIKISCKVFDILLGLIFKWTVICAFKHIIAFHTETHLHNGYNSSNRLNIKLKAKRNH